jgi:hypothetical protein
MIINAPDNSFSEAYFDSFLDLRKYFGIYMIYHASLKMTHMPKI